MEEAAPSMAEATEGRADDVSCSSSSSSSYHSFVSAVDHLGGVVESCMEEMARKQQETLSILKDLLEETKCARADVWQHRHCRIEGRTRVRLPSSQHSKRLRR